MTHWTLRGAVGVMVLLFLLIVSGCSDDEESPSASSDMGDLRVSLRVDPTALDPQRANVTPNIGVVHQLFRGLFWYDAKLNLIPMAAKEVPTQSNGGISQNKLVYRLKLRQGLKWSDGSPLTAFDFEYAGKRLFDPAGGSVRAAAYYDIQGAERYHSCKGCSDAELTRLRAEVGIKAEDATTLVITLKSPRATMLHLMTDPAFFPVPKDTVEKYGDKWTEPENFVGNGPFILKERVLKDHLTLTPNPRWWGTKSRVRSVTFRIIPEIPDAFNAYLSGEIDIVEIPPTQKPTVDRDPVLTKENVRTPLLQTLGYFFNNSTPPFDNPKIRQAFAMALDREGFVANVLQGVGQPTYSWLPPALAGHSKNLGLEWKLNPSKAREMLAQAGYPEGKGLPRITFPYQTSGLNPAYAEFLQTQLRQNLGVEIVLQPMESRAWTEAFLRKEHMVVFVPWSFGADAATSIVEIFGCQKYEGDACMQFPGNNIALYSNPEVDRIMQQANKEPNPGRRADYYAKAERIIVGDTPAAFMLNVNRNILVRPQVRNLVTTPLDSLFPGQYLLERAYVVSN